jgi:hypothetical protein
MVTMISRTFRREKREGRKREEEESRAEDRHIVTGMCNALVLLLLERSPE